MKTIIAIFMSVILLSTSVSLFAQEHNYQNQSAPRLLGEYGEHDISLYKYGGKCFFFIYARNADGDVVGSAIWLPEYNRFLLAFPRSHSANHALQTLHNFDHLSKTSVKFQSSPYYMKIGNQRIELNYSSRFNFSKTVLHADFGGNITSALANHPSFMIYVKPTAGNKAGVVAVFGLDGFADAIRAFNDTPSCHRQ